MTDQDPLFVQPDAKARLLIRQAEDLLASGRPSEELDDLIAQLRQLEADHGIADLFAVGSLWTGRYDSAIQAFKEARE